jgi:hypothetical protein
MRGTHQHPSQRYTPGHTEGPSEAAVPRPDKRGSHYLAPLSDLPVR